ncbi:MAG: hypothetical protein WAV93_05435 [Bacteroidales bacterium]
MSSTGKMYDKVFAIFGTFMVFFYFGLAVLILVYDQFGIDKALRIIISVPLFLYAIYRAFVSYEKIRDSFFIRDDDEK